MNKISTHSTRPRSPKWASNPAKSAKNSTLAVLKQFARTYMPVPNYAGIVLN